jgi:hypothetical protein
MKRDGELGMLGNDGGRHGERGGGEKAAVQDHSNVNALTSSRMRRSNGVARAYDVQHSLLNKYRRVPAYVNCTRTMDRSGSPVPPFPPAQITQDLFFRILRVQSQCQSRVFLRNWINI